MFFQHSFLEYKNTIKPYFTYLVAPLCLYSVYKFSLRLIPGPHQQKRLNLKNRTVLIIGASSGLGRSLAFEFYSQGAKVIVTARSINKLEVLCNELEESNMRNGWNNPHKPVYHYLDLSDLNNESEYGKSLIDELRTLAIDGATIDVLVNNAGISSRGSCKSTKIDVHRQLMEVNYFGTIALTRLLLDAIPKNGAIVIIGSLQSRVALPYRSAYSASKHANQAFFDSLRAEKHYSDIQILMANIGYINTDFGKRALDANGYQIGCIDKNHQNGMEPEYVAHKIVESLKNRKTELILANFFHKIIIYLRIFTPNFLWWILKRRANNEISNK